MKKIIDPALTITITNTQCGYDLSKDKRLMYTTSVTRYRKNGYLTYDEEGREIGIVFFSDDTRTARYGAAEIMFFKQYEQEYGSWRVIQLDETYSKYLMFDTLKKILESKPSYVVTTAERMR